MMRKKEEAKERLDFRSSLRISFTLMIASIVIYSFQGLYPKYSWAFSSILTKFEQKAHVFILDMG